MYIYIYTFTNIYIYTHIHIYIYIYTIAWFLPGHYLIMASFAESRRQQWFQPRGSTKALQSNLKNLAWREGCLKKLQVRDD